jgi:two-component system, chemotaxis family, sensor kinase Cph1
VSTSPAFGQADLTNCERELIHLAGSIQPHGLLLTVRAADRRIVQASVTAAAALGLPLEQLLGLPLAELDADLLQQVDAAMAGDGPPGEPRPLRCRLQRHGAAADAGAEFDGAVHAPAPGLWVIELEPTDAATPGLDLPRARLEAQLGAAVQRFSEAATLGALADAVVRHVRDLTGYDRVMVYKFDPDGHGKVIAEARDPRLESLLGHQYPATDIPQRARELYLRNRVRVLVDVDYEPAPLLPARLPPDVAPTEDGQLDMSMCYLRSMSPLHLQYLRNMGVTATLVVSLIREGRLWGLIACHHYRPRNLRLALRAACELLGEVISTRIGAIENYARAQVAIQVRRLQQRLVEATSTEGDWRLALFRNPRTLLQPLDATGAALLHGGELMTSGEVPSTPELRALLKWIDAQAEPGAPVACAVSSIGRIEPSLASLTPTASGVLAVKLSASQPDYLVWLRKEQMHTVTWAGDPTKPLIDNDPLNLSPRRSFAAWSEIVRGTALAWTSNEIAMASALGDALVDIIVQVNAVRMLIAAHQMAQVRSTIAASKEAVAVIGTAEETFYANAAFHALAGRAADSCRTLDGLLDLFEQPRAVLRMIEYVRAEQHGWRGELALALPDGRTRAVAARAEPVPARDGSLLGFIFILQDLTESKRAADARHQLESSLAHAGRSPQPGTGEASELVGAIIANASLAAMDIVDAGSSPTTASLLQEVESATARAAALCQRIRSYATDRG